MFDTEFFPTPSHVAKHMLHSLKLVPDDAFDRTADPEQRQHLADEIHFHIQPFNRRRRGYY